MMCGIVGYCGKEQAAKIVFDGLKRVEYRGYDSAGVAVVGEGLVVYKDVGTLDQVNEKHSLENLEGTVMIGHTRWSTHGAPTAENSHPHCDCTNEIAVVHNGIIDNFQELREQLIERGHTFSSDTDTEVIPHLIEENICENLEEAVRKACEIIKGSYAILAIASRDPNKIIAVRKDAPLVIGVGEKGNYIASDILSFLHRTNDTLDLEENEIAVVFPDKVEFIADGKKTTKSIKKVDMCSWDVDKGSHPFYMRKEIEELPWAVVDASIQDKTLFSDVAMDVLRARQVIITACGTSRYAALVGRYLLSKVGRKFCDVVMASELQYFSDSIDKDTLILAVSQSGETADVVQGVKMAKQSGAHIVSIVNRPLTILDGMSDRMIHLNCGAEVSVAATKSFVGQLGIFYLIAHAMVSSFDVAVADMRHIGREIANAISWNNAEIETLAKDLSKKNDWYYIARGINFAVASEGALKLKEISYAHAEGMPAGELKHGTLSLVVDGTPIVVVCPDDYTYSETLANAIEAKSRGGYIIGVSDRQNEVYDCWLRIPKVSQLCYPLVVIAPIYLLAYNIALERGYNPDMPRNLAKSVTVK